MFGTNCQTEVMISEGKAKPAELVSLLNIPVCFEFLV